jgi:hypothetical protein
MRPLQVSSAALEPWFRYLAATKALASRPGAPMRGLRQPCRNLALALNEVARDRKAYAAQVIDRKGQR